jgi:hypothetical protein
MNARIPVAAMISALVLGASCAWAKIPPPPPPDEKAKAAAEEKKAKDAAAAEKAKADQAAVEEATVKNFQANMRKKGKPIPKPTPIAAAAPAKPGEPAKAAAKPGEAAKAAEKKDAKK